MPRLVCSAMSGCVVEEVNSCLFFSPCHEINCTCEGGPLLPYLAVTAHLVALAEALLLGGAQGVPGHDVITQSHMHAAAGLGLACI